MIQLAQSCLDNGGPTALLVHYTCKIRTIKPTKPVVKLYIDRSSFSSHDDCIQWQ